MLPADEISVAFVDVDGVAVTVRYIGQSMLVDGDVGRQREWY